MNNDIPNNVASMSLEQLAQLWNARPDLREAHAAWLNSPTFLVTKLIWQKLGTPLPIQYHTPNLGEVSAMAHHHTAGFYRAIEALETLKEPFQLAPKANQQGPWDHIMDPMYGPGSSPKQQPTE